MNVPKTECFGYANQMLCNADKQWESAQMLAGIENFGGAISYAIISVEETVNAIVLTLDGHGYNFRQVKGIDRFFSNHEIRYVLSYFLFLMSIFGEELEKFLNKLLVNPKVSFNLIKGIQIEDPHYMTRLKWYVMKKAVEFKKEYEWFSQVDAKRQSGFYTDFLGQLKSPLNISKSEFETVFKKMTNVKNVGSELIASIQSNNESLLKPFEDMREEFKQKDYYAKIETWLLNMRKSKLRPFDYLRNQMLQLKSR